ncbi:MAG: MATE family efflux transporter [Clostridia bacterium]|nr:MATE family efflux transporter [Clostridia bacterium]
MTAEQKQKDMLETPIHRLIPKLAVPTIISMLVTSFYNMADTFFVGQLDDPSATAAVGVVFSYMAVLQAIGFMFGHGAGNFISRCLGKGETERASCMAVTSFVSALATGALLAVLGLCFLEPLSRFLGSTETILPYTKDYLRFILIASPWMMASFVLNNQLRFQGSATYAMVGIVAGAVINIGLDPLLMFVFDMGVQGAAIATAFSQLVSFSVLWIGTGRGGNLKMKLQNITLRLWVYAEILRGGIPSLFRQGLASISAICLNKVAGSLGGDAAIAGMSIVSRVMMFANSAMIGFGQGLQPVCGFNYGAGKYDRVRQGFWFCVKWAALFLTAIGIAGVIFAPTIVSWFQSDETVRQVAKWALRFQCITFVLNSWIVPSNMMLQAVGKTVGASLLAASRNGILFLPPLYILSYFFDITGMQLAQPIADVCSCLLAIPLTFKFFKEIKINKQH